MLRKLVCILVIGLFALGVLGGITQGHNAMPPVIKKAPNPTIKYTMHAPIRINNDSDFNNQFSNRTIWGLEINGTGYGFCIYIGNCSQPFTVKNCYLHNASGTSGVIYSDNLGLFLYKSSNGTILSNTFDMNVHWSIELCYAKLTMLISNTISGNNLIGDSGGIDLAGAENITLKQNIMHDCSITFMGLVKSYYNTQNIDETNLVNNKPVYYLKNQTAMTVPPGRGLVIIANCSDITINKQTTENGTDGIQVYFSEKCIITHNDCNQNDNGIVLIESDFNTLTDNNCTQNVFDGIDLYNHSDNNTCNGNNCSDDPNVGISVMGDMNLLINNTCTESISYGYGILMNTAKYNTIKYNTFSDNSNYGVLVRSDCQFNHIYQNKFINNSPTKQAYDDSGLNFWNTSGSPHGYGNYWSDWTSPDNNSDGIVDFPYHLDGGMGATDYYPLTTSVVIPESPPPALVMLLLVIVPLTYVIRRRNI